MARDTISPPNAMPLETVSPPVVVVVFVVFCCWCRHRRRRCCGSYCCCSWFVLQKFLNDVYQKIKDIRLLDRLSYIFFLERTAFVQLAVVPTSYAEIEDEEFAGFGKQDGSLRRNHADVFVGLHDSFDTSEGQIVVGLEILFRLFCVVLDDLQLILPELAQTSVELGQELRARGRRCRGLWNNACRRRRRRGRIYVHGGCHRGRCGRGRHEHRIRNFGASCSSHRRRSSSRRRIRHHHVLRRVFGHGVRCRGGRCGSRGGRCRGR